MNNLFLLKKKKKNAGHRGSPTSLLSRQMYIPENPCSCFYTKCRCEDKKIGTKLAIKKRIFATIRQITGISEYLQDGCCLSLFGPGSCKTSDPKYRQKNQMFGESCNF